MADEPTPPADNQPPAQTPAQVTPVEPKPEANGDADPKIQTYMKQVQEYEDYKGRVEPVLETILADPDLYKTVLDSHQRRMGIAPKDDPNPDTPQIQEPKVSPVEVDNRNALVAQTVNKFEEETGLSKLSPEERKDINIKVGNVLTRMLDPQGTSGKPITQLINEVSLVQLPQILKDAHYLATREERERAIAEKAVSQFVDNESGAIGSMASGSVEVDNVTLTQAEKLTAKKMGIDEKTYLENKKQIIKRDGQLY